MVVASLSLASTVHGPPWLWACCFASCLSARVLVGRVRQNLATSIGHSSRPKCIFPTNRMLAAVRFPPQESIGDSMVGMKRQSAVLTQATGAS